MLKSLIESALLSEAGYKEPKLQGPGRLWTSYRKAPKEVKAVVDALFANALEAERSHRKDFGSDDDPKEDVENAKDRVYLDYDENKPLPFLSGRERDEWVTRPYWSMGDNYERSGGFLIYYPDKGEWAYRRSHDGREKPSSYSAALSDAKMFFTG